MVNSMFRRNSYCTLTIHEPGDHSRLFATITFRIVDKAAKAIDKFKALVFLWSEQVFRAMLLNASWWHPEL